MGTRPSWLATPRSQELPYIWGSPSFNVDCASQILSGAALFEDLLHLLSLVVPRDICYYENLFWCLFLHYSFPACGPDNVWFSLLPNPWLFAKWKCFMFRNKERSVIGGGISAEI